MEKKIVRQFRQGDVLIHPIDAIPDSAMKSKHAGRVVLAEGEATGHEHAITATLKKLETYTDGQETYLRVKSPVSLRHQEHGEIVIDPGDYVVKRQVETWLDEVRRVAD